MPSLSVPSPDHKALILCVADYEHYSRLRGPRKDVFAIRDALVDRDIGLFREDRVQQLVNIDSVRAYKVLKEFFTASTDTDHLVFYFSGHGQVDDRDQLYLCFDTTEHDALPATAVAWADISHLVDTAPARTVTVILDCCYSGQSKGGGSATLGISSARGRCKLSSSLEYESTKDSAIAGRPSPYTELVVRALHAPTAAAIERGWVTPAEVARYVDENRGAALKHTPMSETKGVGEIALARAPRMPQVGSKLVEDKPKVPLVPLVGATCGLVGIALWIALGHTSVTHDGPLDLAITLQKGPLTIPTSWERPAPAATAQGACGPAGEGGDPDRNRRKNRVDAANAYHGVTLHSLRGLPDEPARIAPYQGVAISAVGHLVTAKVEGRGHGQSANCHLTDQDHLEWDLSLAETPDAPRDVAITAVITPRVRASHPSWALERLTALARSRAIVRVSGWSMFDPEMRPFVGKFRATAWEIDPVTRIELYRDGQWLDIDDPTAPDQPAAPPPAVTRVEGSVLLVDAHCNDKSLSCCGFVVAARTAAVPARCLPDPSCKVQVQTTASFHCEGKRIGTAHFQDERWAPIAVLDIGDCQARPVTIANEVGSASLGGRAFTWNRTANPDEAVALEGRIMSLGQDEIIVSFPGRIVAGASGQPVVDESGRVIGMLEGTRDGSVFAATAMQLRDALREYALVP